MNFYQFKVTFISRVNVPRILLWKTHEVQNLCRSCYQYDCTETSVWRIHRPVLVRGLY